MSTLRELAEQFVKDKGINTHWRGIAIYLVPLFVEFAEALQAECEAKLEDWQAAHPDCADCCPVRGSGAPPTTQQKLREAEAKITALEAELKSARKERDEWALQSSENESSLRDIRLEMSYLAHREYDDNAATAFENRRNLAASIAKQLDLSDAERVEMRLAGTEHGSHGASIIRWLILKLRCRAEIAETELAACEARMREVRELLIQKDMLSEFIYRDDDTDLFTCVYCDSSSVKAADMRHADKCKLGQLLAVIRDKGTPDAK